MRPRIDLDGVALTDERDPHMVVAIFRYRTTEGLVLLQPESVDVVIPWAKVRGSVLDLATGLLTLDLDPAFVASQNWLRGANRLVGRWTDRMTLTGENRGSGT